MENLDFSEEEIQEQLEILGYKNIPKHKLREFKRDLDELIQHGEWERLVSPTQINSTKSQRAMTQPSPPAFTKEKVSQCYFEDSGKGFFLHAGKADNDRQVLTACQNKDYGGQQTSCDSYAKHSVAPKLQLPPGAPSRLQVEPDPDDTLHPPLTDSCTSSPDTQGSRVIKRKVLRKHQGQSLVCDESIYSEDSDSTSHTSAGEQVATMYKMYNTQWDDEESNDDKNSLASSFWSDGERQRDEEEDEKVEMEQVISEKDSKPVSNAEDSVQEASEEKKPGLNNEDDQDRSDNEEDDDENEDDEESEDEDNENDDDENKVDDENEVGDESEDDDENEDEDDENEDDLDENEDAVYSENVDEENNDDDDENGDDNVEDEHNKNEDDPDKNENVVEKNEDEDNENEGYLDKNENGVDDKNQDDENKNEDNHNENEDEEYKDDDNKNYENEEDDEDKSCDSSSDSPAPSLMTSGYGTYRPEEQDGGDYRDDHTITEFDQDSRADLSEMRDDEDVDNSFYSFGGFDVEPTEFDCSETLSSSFLADTEPEATVDFGRDVGLHEGMNFTDMSSEDKEQTYEEKLEEDLHAVCDNEVINTTLDEQQHDAAEMKDTFIFNEKQLEGGSVNVEERKQNKRLEEAVQDLQTENKMKKEDKVESGESDESSSNKDIKFIDSKVDFRKMTFDKMCADWEGNLRATKDVDSRLEERLAELNLFTSARPDFECEDASSQSTTESSESGEISMSAFESYIRGMTQDQRDSYIRPKPKSFIRPVKSQQAIKKSDPVAKYFRYKQFWEMFKLPGETDRRALRLEIKERLTYQPPPPKPRRVYVPNDYIVPTEKKRSALRWEIRNDLANGLMPCKYSH